MNSVLSTMGAGFMGIDLGTLLEVVIGSAGSAIAVYAGIRADLAKFMERATNAQDMAERAHARIDDLLKVRGR